ncbi:hypothetical protein CMI48_00635 [Candidatus Pacearchaeota archaeon]|nr:hypothetical protein [Candidatus Pacearchaeota archaeon]|tara:strand:+ start:174 stop:683 length:510 start_codon:yes stop_codon:yes gene_type:complete
MAVDVSFMTYFAPILAYLLVALVVGAVLMKYELVGQGWVAVLIALIVASFFVSFAGVQRYVVAIGAWFGVLAVAVLFLLFLLAFVKGKAEFPAGLGVGVVVVALLVFVIAGIQVFSHVLGPYLPGSVAYGSGNPGVGGAVEWVISPQVLGGIFLLVVSGLAAWVLTKSS